MKKRLGKPLIKPNPKHTGGTHYQDEQGNTIDKATFEKLQAKNKKLAEKSAAKKQADEAQAKLNEGAK